VKKNIILVLAVLAVGGASAGLVAAVELDQAHTATVVANCGLAQSTLQRFRNSDTSTRINRGRNYDQVLKLFYAMNARAANNNITEPRLADLTKNFEDRLNDFRNRYNEYNDRLKGTIDIDCKQQPAAFYDDLTKSREKRADIKAVISELDALISRYQTTVEELKL
jgi:anaerobic glycerol-3-phosphate dehydrogenase